MIGPVFNLMYTVFLEGDGGVKCYNFFIAYAEVLVHFLRTFKLR